MTFGAERKREYYVDFLENIISGTREFFLHTTNSVRREDQRDRRVFNNVVYYALIPLWLCLGQRRFRALNNHSFILRFCCVSFCRNQGYPKSFTMTLEVIRRSRIILLYFSYWKYSINHGLGLNKCNIPWHLTQYFTEFFLHLYKTVVALHEIEPGCCGRIWPATSRIQVDAHFFSEQQVSSLNTAIAGEFYVYEIDIPNDPGK